ncbi:MAG: transforming growth factor-beta-induced protein, partial [Gammaproteobacteria bacterium]
TLQGAGPFTVFAPTDAAFAALPKGTVESLLLPENKAKLAGILTFHVAAGRSPASDVVRRSSIATVNGQRVAIEADKRGVRIGGAMISSTDIQCTNGTIHVLDAVMLPSTLNVVQTAVEAGTFKTLAAALGAGGLVRVLEGPGPFTVFAPTDEAFAALPKGTVESLLLPENKDLLVAILKNHVVSGRVYSDQLSSGRVASIGGTKLTVKVSEAGVMVGAAKVISADIETTNGVVHAVNAVILPE